MYLQTFTIRGEPFGESFHPDYQGRQDKVKFGPPWSKAWFCPLCGEVWATCRVEDDDGKTVSFHVYTFKCDRHAPYTFGWMVEVPGTIWIDFEKDFQDSLPPKVLEREVSLMTRAYEKGILAGGQID